MFLLIDCMVFNSVSTVFQLYCAGQCTYPCFPGVLFSSTPHNILSESLAAFLHNHCRKNRRRWERNESCRNDYRQSRKEDWPSQGLNQQPLVLKSAALPSVLWGLAHVFWHQNFMINFWKGSHKEYSCEIISKSDQCFKRRFSKKGLSIWLPWKPEFLMESNSVNTI